MLEFEISQLVDCAMARYGNGREVVSASEVVDLLLDIRLLTDRLAERALGETEATIPV